MWRKRLRLLVVLLSGSVTLTAAAATAQQPKLPEFTPRSIVPGAAAYRAQGQPVRPETNGQIVLEAEEFKLVRPGWQRKTYGENFYVSTFAVTFLSRRGFLAARPDAQDAVAEIKFTVPQEGRYFVLVRYEAAYRFHTQFRVEIEQAGQVKLRRMYGSLENLRLWPFRRGLQKDLTWPWGANEQIVWEGLDVRVPLKPGLATLRLVATGQPEPATWRHVDCVLLTTDEEEIKRQRARAYYLPLDGMLTQAGDVWARVENHSVGALQVTFPPCRAHSPYWVHVRRWKAKQAMLPPGKASEWIEVGSLLDTLNHSVWTPRFRAVNGPRDYTLQLAVKDASGKLQPFFKHRGRQEQLSLYVDGALRYVPHVMLTREALPQLLGYLQRRSQLERLPARSLRHVPIYCYTFGKIPGDEAYNRDVERWIELFPLSPTDMSHPGTPERPRGYIDVRGVPTPKLEAYCKQLVQKGQADRVLVVSLGDEIALPRARENQDEAFRRWCRQQGLRPEQVVPGAKDWQAVKFSPPPDREEEPRRFYYTRRYLQDYGIEAIKKRTDILRRYLPAAGIGANYSPHHGFHYLGEVHKWVHVFRRQGMTLPWSEDYIWQTPVASQQVNSLGLDLFRAGLRGRKDQRILYYVMPHWPGNTPQSWRRLFYACLGHGMKIANLFEFRPLPVAYTENYVNHPETYWQVLKTARELALFEDIVAQGHVVPGNVGLWFSRTGDIWLDYKEPYAAEKRTLYVALRQLQLPVEVVIEADAEQGKLAPYHTIYMLERHVTRKAAAGLLQWVRSGGRLFLLPGAGSRDEVDQPLDLLYRPLGTGVPKLKLEESVPLRFVKQDLPFAPAVGQVQGTPEGGKRSFPVYGARAQLPATKGAEVLQKFADGEPALCRVAVGKGAIYYCGYLPALAAVRPSVRKVPVTRGGGMNSPSHSVPTRWQPEALAALRAPVARVRLPVEARPGLVETCLLESPQGTALVLAVWKNGPVDATIVLRRKVPTARVETATGAPLEMVRLQDGSLQLKLRVEYGEAIIFRPR